MKNIIRSTVMALVLATVSSVFGASSFTGQQNGMPWLEFVKTMEASPTGLTAFSNIISAASEANTLTRPTIRDLTTFAPVGTYPAGTIGFGEFFATSGLINFENGTSNSICWEASPASTDVCLSVNSSEQFVFTGPLLSPVIATGLTASGSAANTFAGSTGTFITSTGANTLSGAVTVNDATTPSVTLAAGKTNSGFFSALGKTSGGIKILPADASGFLLTLTNTAQTVGTASITIPDFAGVSDVPVFQTLAQTLASKTLTTPVIATGLTASGSASNDFSGSTGTFKTSSGNTTISGAEVRSTDALSGAGAVSVTKCVTKLTTTGSAQALTLADGVDGQVKTIVHDVDGGSAVLTPATKTGFTIITFTAVGESATLVFVTTRGWIILSIVGAVAS